MSQIDTANSLATIGASGSGDAGKSNALRDLDLDQFLKLMIAELQNQDPLDPMDNTEILQQVSQLREIGATDSLSDTLSAVLQGQNLSTASAMIGRDVKALADDGRNVEGKVDRVSIDVEGENRTLRVHIGGESVQLKNIRDVTPPATT